MPVIDDRRAIGLGQPVEMGHVEPCLLHVGQELFRGRCRGGEELDPVIKRPFDALGGGNHQRHHNRRAAKMRHALLCERLPDRFGAHLTQADMRADDGRERPRETPAVAMKHRQGPQVDRMFGHGGGQRIALCQEIRTPVMRDHTLGVACGAGCVIDRNRVPFILWHQPVIGRIASRQEGVVIFCLGRDARPRELRIIILDEERGGCCKRQRLLHQGHEFAVHDHDL